MQQENIQRPRLRKDTVTDKYLDVNDKYRVLNDYQKLCLGIYVDQLKRIEGNKHVLGSYTREATTMTHRFVERQKTCENERKILLAPADRKPTLGVYVSDSTHKTHLVSRANYERAYARLYPPQQLKRSIPMTINDDERLLEGDGVIPRQALRRKVVHSIAKTMTSRELSRVARTAGRREVAAIQSEADPVRLYHASRVFQMALGAHNVKKNPTAYFYG